MVSILESTKRRRERCNHRQVWAVNVSIENSLSFSRHDSPGNSPAKFTAEQLWFKGAVGTLVFMEGEVKTRIMSVAIETCCFHDGIACSIRSTPLARCYRYHGVQSRPLLTALPFNVYPERRYNGWV